MRIGFDARWYNDSGVGTYVCGLLDAYSRIEDDSIQIVAFEDPNNSLPIPTGGVLRKVEIGVRRYSLSEQLALPLLCRRERIELLHSPFFVVPQLSSCPVIATFFDLAPFHFPLYGAAKAAVIKFGYWAASRRAAKILTCSEHSARDIQSTLGVSGRRLRSIPLACSGESFVPSSSRMDSEVLRRFNVQKPYVMLIGARNWRTKNFANGFKALTRARHISRVEFQVVFPGSTESLGEPSVKAAAAGIEFRVPGLISNAELAALYRHATAFLFPSRFEGFGIPVLEAMSCGCAVVCSNAASLPEVAGDGAIMVHPDDTESMAQGLATLLHDPDARQLWKARALRRASNFSFARTANETLKLYREVLCGTPSGEVSPQGKQCQEVRSSRA